MASSKVSVGRGYFDLKRGKSTENRMHHEFAAKIIMECRKSQKNHQRHVEVHQTSEAGGSKLPPQTSVSSLRRVFLGSQGPQRFLRAIWLKSWRRARTKEDFGTSATIKVSCGLRLTRLKILANWFSRGLTPARVGIQSACILKPTFMRLIYNHFGFETLTKLEHSIAMYYVPKWWVKQEWVGD